MPDEAKPRTWSWPDLTWRLDKLDSQHAHVTVFDRGQHAGTLVLDPRTWELLAAGASFPDSPEQIAAEEAAKLGRPGPGW